MFVFKAISGLAQAILSLREHQVTAVVQPTYFRRSKGEGTLGRCCPEMLEEVILYQKVCRSFKVQPQDLLLEWL